MIDFSKGYSLDEYFQKGYEEERDRQKRACERTHCSPEFEAAVKAVAKPVLLAAFTEIYCPDSVVTMPFVKRAVDLNSLIRLAVFERDPFRRELEALSGAVKIPTLIFFDEAMDVKGKYVELPDRLREELEDADPDERSAMTLEYRRGKYNHVIQEHFISVLREFS